MGKSNDDNEHAHPLRTRSLGGLTKTDAEELLDWLDANGYQDVELQYEDGKGFVVRWLEAEDRFDCPDHTRGGATLSEILLSAGKAVPRRPPVPS